MTRPPAKTLSGEPLRAHFDRARYAPGQRAGHYESYYLRANHPTRPLAFWLRYTVFQPHRDPQGAIGELWAVVFDGERNRHVAAKSELPIDQCRFERDGFGVAVGAAHLDSRALTGEAVSGGHHIAWDLRYRDAGAPILLLPRWAYDGRIAKAQSVVPRPGVLFDGHLMVDGERWSVTYWRGSQNHNWGVKHTDHYAFGQVAGFDGQPDSFLEVATARLKLGPVWTPFLTMLVLRHEGREYALNALATIVRADASVDFFDWRFTTGNRDVRIEGRITAPREAFVGLRYYNPPGGDKHCLNTKIGACELRVTDRGSGRTFELHTDNRALFELIPPTTDAQHGVAIQA